jgi:hypothetical protein
MKVNEDQLKRKYVVETVSVECPTVLCVFVFREDEIRKTFIVRSFKENQYANTM